MTALFPDSHPKIEALQIDLIRRMPPWRKMAVVGSLNETVRTLAVSGIKQRHPQATPEQVRRMLAQILLGAELAQKVYGQMEWYRKGGEVSEQQWRDVLGVLKTRAGELDLDYLRKWADELHIADLLDRALKQSGEDSTSFGAAGS